MEIPLAWHIFIKEFKQQYHTSIVFDFVRVYPDLQAIQERYLTYEFQEYLPGYLPIADDSGGQFAVISTSFEDSRVYLSSSGTLIQDDLKVLAHSLQHWMQREFNFQSLDSQACDQQELMGLYIWNMGPNKRKMLSLLKSQFNVSAIMALELYKKEKLCFKKSNRTILEQAALPLRSIGAIVSIEPIK